MRSWRAVAVFLTVVTSLSAGLHYYLFTRLVRAPGIEAWQSPGAWLFFAGAVAMPAGMVLSRVLRRPLSTIVGAVSHVWMGVFALLLFLTLGSEIVRGGAAILEALNLLPRDPERGVVIAQALSGVIGLATLGLGTYGVARARTPDVKTVDVALRRLPAELGGFRIVQLSDLHIGALLDGAWLRGVVERVNALEPDLVAITGDLVDGSVADLAAHVAPLGELAARHGVFFVTGNHEYYSGADAWIAELERLGVRVLRNERVAIGVGFELAGIDDYTAHQFGNGHGSDLQRALAGRDPAHELVLMAHQPRSAKEAASFGVGLQLSGHTHAGQIWPWRYAVKLQSPWVEGLYREGTLQLYVSPGTGYWGPPMRLGSEAEITEVLLYPHGHSQRAQNNDRQR